MQSAPPTPGASSQVKHKQATTARKNVPSATPFAQAVPDTTGADDVAGQSTEQLLARAELTRAQTNQHTELSLSKYSPKTQMNLRLTVANQHMAEKINRQPQQASVPPPTPGGSGETGMPFTPHGQYVAPFTPQHHGQPHYQQHGPSPYAQGGFQAPLPYGQGGTGSTGPAATPFSGSGPTPPTMFGSGMGPAPGSGASLNHQGGNVQVSGVEGHHGSAGGPPPNAPAAPAQAIGGGPPAPVGFAGPPPNAPVASGQALGGGVVAPRFNAPAQWFRDDPWRFEDGEHTHIITGKQHNNFPAIILRRTQGLRAHTERLLMRRPDGYFEVIHKQKTSIAPKP